MDWLIPTLLLALTGSLTLVLVYLNLYLREREKHLSLWLASWSLYTVRFFFEVLMAVGWEHKILVAAAPLSGIWSRSVLALGYLSLFGKEAEEQLAGTLCRRKPLGHYRLTSFSFPSPWTTIPTLCFPRSQAS